MAQPIPAGSDAYAANAAAAGSETAAAMAVFELFEVVRVRATPDTIQQELAGLEGPVLGTSQGGAGEILAYAVMLYGRGGTSWSLAPSDLKATGRHDRHENLNHRTPLSFSPRSELLRWNEPLAKD